MTAEKAKEIMLSVQSGVRPAVVLLKCKGCWWEPSMNSERKEKDAEHLLSLQSV